MNDINQRFARFRACCDDAPSRTFKLSREVRDIIGQHTDAIRREVMALGVTPSNSDGAHNVEATIYEWITKAKDAPSEFIVAEGYGSAMDSPRAVEIKEKLERDRDFIENHKLLNEMHS